MKKSILLCAIFLLLDLNVIAQVNNWLWAKTGNGAVDGKTNQVSAITTDATGNCYITGSFGSEFITFGSITLFNFDTTLIWENHDIFIVKYDPNGNVVWAKCAGGESTEFSGDIKTDFAGNVYVTGTFLSNSITFGSITLPCSPSFNGSFPSTLFIVKFDPLGNVLWAKAPISTGYDSNWGASVDSAGNVYITGQFNGPHMTFGSTVIANTNNKFDVFIAKYNASGTALWARSAGGIYDDGGSAISCDKNGNVLLTGTFKSPSIVFGSSILIKSDSINSKGDVFIVKYNNSGNVIWAKKAGGKSNEFSTGISVDNEGNSLITGGFGPDSISFNSIKLFSKGKKDIFIAKYDPTGSILWAKGSGGNSDDYSSGICTDNKGNSYIAGSFRSSTISIGGTILTNASNMGYENILIEKFDSTGNVIWAKSIAGSYMDWANCIATDLNKNLFVGGGYGSNPLQFGNLILPPTASWFDAFTAKFGTLLGIEDSPVAMDVKFFPNPSSGQVIIEAHEIIEKIKFMNINGQVTFEANPLTESFTINLSAPGLYFVSILIAKQVFIKKIIICP